MFVEPTLMAPALRVGTGRAPRRVSSPLSTGSTDIQILVLLVPVGAPVRFLVVSVTPIVAPAPVDAGAPRLLILRSGFSLNAAVQDLSASSVTTPSAQSASPDQPPKTQGASAVGVSVTTVPTSKLFT